MRIAGRDPHPQLPRGCRLAKRNNYQQEKRSKELDKQKKKEAKKERKLNRERQETDAVEPEQGKDDSQGQIVENDAA